MIVLKFGGTSLSCPRCFLQSVRVITGMNTGNPFTVVVSASGDTTDKLMEAGEKAASGDQDYVAVLRVVENTHFALVRKLFPVKQQSKLLAQIKLLLNEAEELAGGIFVTRDLTEKARDRLLGFGELLSSILMQECLESRGLEVELADARKFIRTTRSSGIQGVDNQLTFKLIRETLKPGRNYVVPGFIATDTDGSPSSLGRNGSDHTAALIAAALKADELDIWTDVSGVMTADPGKVPQARTIEQMNYEEAMELSTFGAKIIHPPALQPVMQEGIRVRIKNTFEPELPGTLIARSANGGEEPVKGISVMEDIALLTLTGNSMIGVPGIAGRYFRALSERRINVVFITQASSEHSITAGVQETYVQEAAQSVNDEFSSEITLRKVNPVSVEQGLSIVAIVGNNMKRKVGLSGKTFAALGRNGINVVAIAQGSTERNISVVIDKKDVRKALNVLHETHFLSRIKKVNLFIVGIGNVGSALLEQISTQREKIKKDFSVEFNICGLANTKKMLQDTGGIPPDRLRELLEKKGEKTDMIKFVENIKLFNLRNSVFVDNTASHEIAGLYGGLLKTSVSVVAANKIAFSGSLEVYRQNKILAREKNANLLFEANVGAGLPVIKTINDLVQSGDRINRVEAVLSGSLNYIFNRYTGEKTFAEVVREAMATGLTEPDPRLDLDGEDVARKILILARESGIELEPEDVEKKSFLPEECRKTQDTDAFLDCVANHEKFFSSMRNNAEREGKKLRYVARYNQGKAITGLEGIGPGHPFYELEGKDNILIFYTDRYFDQPLMIRGAGAGAEVTASGVFADIMRMAR
ncbi:MAG: bifunctional aspartate kinase/homoserine dehydrogenase I [Chlorobi bacterium]|nr:bifunctional aspartate kinase/homoserine dehydrogenase I [Chlorobiota bacterium]